MFACGQGTLESSHCRRLCAHAFCDLRLRKPGLLAGLEQQIEQSALLAFDDFLKFSSIVRAFFEDDVASLPKELHNAFELKKLIYSRSAKLRQLPSLRLYFAYTGEFSVDSQPVKNAIDAEVETLRDKKYMFSEVIGQICDGKALAQLYRDTKNDVSQAIPLGSRMGSTLVWFEVSSQPRARRSSTVHLLCQQRCHNARRMAYAWGYASDLQ